MYDSSKTAESCRGCVHAAVLNQGRLQLQQNSKIDVVNNSADTTMSTITQRRGEQATQQQPLAKQIRSPPDNEEDHLADGSFGAAKYPTHPDDIITTTIHCQEHITPTVTKDFMLRDLSIIKLEPESESDTDTSSKAEAKDNLHQSQEPLSIITLLTMGWTPNYTILDELAWPHHSSGGTTFKSPLAQYNSLPAKKGEITSTSPPTESSSTNTNNNRKEEEDEAPPYGGVGVTVERPPPYSEIVVAAAAAKTAPEPPRKRLCDVCENNNFLRTLHYPSDMIKFRWAC
ncbi:uncharacterized protein B0T15DRAFT_499580 [Chaetomium strumarium]|uniref:Uncharacterized protein n=1 Tax=Chaetomium strumarium TaxID=1170767 RepID=A0AAJ0H533_9PEZI|nr:hypothetical protein B0T15DRAFT_499580 [Chaetomium strumarium]